VCPLQQGYLRGEHDTDTTGSFGATSSVQRMSLMGRMREFAPEGSGRPWRRQQPQRDLRPQYFVQPPFRPPPVPGRGEKKSIVEEADVHA
jgi:hypothetical protein